MSDDASNPYASPRAPLTHPSPQPFHWRLIPAAFIFSIGAASFCFGLFAVAIAIYVLIALQRFDHVTEMSAGCMLYLGFGALWMGAGSLCARGQFRNALLAAVAGVSIPFILVMIMGV